MFSKKIPTNLPKIYCKINIHSEPNTATIHFYGLLAYKTVNNFLEIAKKKDGITMGANVCIDLFDIDFVYHFLANENFIPISETFFYRDMEAKDQLGNS